MKKENDKQKESNALGKFGNAFLKTPRNIIDSLFYGKPEEKSTARLYLCLFYLCSYTEKITEWKGKVYSQPRGVWIGEIGELSDCLGMTARCLRRHLTKLEKDGRITVNSIFRGVSITVHGYATFTDVTPPSPKEPKETPKERAQREYNEMVAKLKAGKYV